MAATEQTDLVGKSTSSRSQASLRSGVQLTAYLAHMFVQGLIVIVPIVVAVYVILWILESAEGFARGLIFEHLPGEYYVPGMGLALLIAATLLVGWLAAQARPRLALRLAERLMRRTPLFGMVYSPVRDLMNLFGDGVQDRLGQVVLIEIPNTNIETLGFITREDLSDLPDGLCKDDHVIVYVQWSSQIGGYCFVVPRSAVRPVNVSVEEGMRWALTAGISAPTCNRSDDDGKGGSQPSNVVSRAPHCEFQQEAIQSGYPSDVVSRKGEETCRQTISRSI